MLSVVACTDKSQQKQGEPIPIFIEMSQQDTTEVLNLVNQYLGYLTDGRTEEALGMIKVLDGDSIKDVPEELLKKQRNSINMLHPIRYEIDSYIFLFEDDCEVKYKGILFDKEEGDPAPNTVSYMIRPVRLNHTWYLTLADSQDINTINSDIKN
jgi:hypothetical protein